jgi:uncharacterized membrane protein
MENILARISRSIEVDEPVGTITEQWNEFERTPRYVARGAVSRVRWRAEVLTFEPTGDGTRVTLRIDYEPSAGDAALSRSVELALEAFRHFLAERSAGGASWRAGPAEPDGWRS